MNQEILLKTKPMSVNDCWQGRRFKTREYKSYEQELLLTLPNRKIAEDKLEIELEVGYSNSLCDIDNFIKPLLDILQKKYGFNDRQIYALHVYKEVVKKGEEYIKINISSYE